LLNQSLYNSVACDRDIAFMTVGSYAMDTVVARPDYDILIITKDKKTRFKKEKKWTELNKNSAYLVDFFYIDSNLITKVLSRSSDSLFLDKLWLGPFEMLMQFVLYYNSINWKTPNYKNVIEQAVEGKKSFFWKNYVYQLCGPPMQQNIKNDQKVYTKVLLQSAPLIINYFQHGIAFHTVEQRNIIKMYKTLYYQHRNGNNKDLSINCYTEIALKYADTLQAIQAPDYIQLS